MPTSMQILFTRRGVDRQVWIAHGARRPSSSHRLAGGAASAVGRSVGWISQWIEMAGENVSRISRPRQMYEGALERPFVPISEREGDAGDEEDPIDSRPDSADDLHHLGRMLSVRIANSHGA